MNLIPGDVEIKDLHFKAWVSYDKYFLGINIYPSKFSECKFLEVSQNFTSSHFVNIRICLKNSFTHSNRHILAYRLNCCSMLFQIPCIENVHSLARSSFPLQNSAEVISGKFPASHAKIICSDLLGIQVTYGGTIK